MGSIEALRLFQWGKETTRGTAVAATSKIATPKLDFEPSDLVYRPSLAKGLAHRHPGSEAIVMRGSKWTMPDMPLNYEQAQHWASMAIKGGVTATGVDPYTWTFARSLTADPAPDSWTIERRLSDGSTNTDNEWAYSLASRLAWSWAQGEPIMFSAEGFARRVQASTLTAALTMPTVEIPPVALAKLYIDTTWAGIGGTQVTGQILAASVEFMTGFKIIMTLDARTDLDFTAHVLDFNEVGLNVEITALLGGQYATEKTAAEAQTLRAVRLQVDGTQSRQIQWDMLLRHEAGSMFKVGEQDGQDIVVLRLVDTDDGTNMFQYKIVNKTNVYT